MSKVSIIFVLMVLLILTLTPAMPMAASPDRGSATVTPTIAKPVDILPRSTPTPPIVEPLDYDPEEMEELRRALLDIADVLDELYPYAETYAQVSGQELPPRVDRQLIKEIMPEGLYLVREALGGEEEVKSFLDNIGALKSLVLTPEKKSSEGEEGFKPSPDSPTMLASSSMSPLTSIGIIPAPTPVTTPPPGIRHEGHDQTNEDAGDLEEPDYFPVCPKTRYPNAAVLTVLLASFITREVDDFAEAASCQGTFLMVCVPFGGGTNLPGCLGWGILKGIHLVTSAVLEGLNYCIGAIDFVEILKAWENTEILHAELHMHDQNLTTRFNWTDNALFHFRNLNLRSRIEDNLASPEDDPIALFTLPSAICITTDLEVISADNPKFSSGRIAGCGLLEVVSDTVRSAIDMNQIAGQDVNNAEAEFAAAVQHYNNGEWKLAYARFRKAYREAVRP
jgi:hypothetical protein